MNVFERGLFGGTGLPKGICVVIAVIAIGMGSAFAVTETVTSIAGSGNTDPFVWFEFAVVSGGTASIVDLTGAGGDLENLQPLPVGAALLTTDGTNASKAEIGIILPSLLAAPIFPFAELGYSYHKVSGGPPAAAPSIKITLWSQTCPFGGDCFGTLVYEPYVQGAGNPPTDTWTSVFIDANTGGGDGPNVGGFWWTGGFGTGSSAGGPPYQSLNEWQAAFNGNFDSAIVLVLSVGLGSFNPDQVGYFDNVRLGLGPDEIIWDFEFPVPCDDPAPRGQGYWHRQCLGVPVGDGGIDPGRGRGPQSPTEPDFEKTLMPTVSGLLGALVYEDQTCEGMDADPPSDPCQRAIKQYTTLLLNIASGRIPSSCTVDVGCGAGTIPELVGAIAALINSDECDAAAACATAVNEGDGNLESAAIETIVQTDPVDETPVATAGARSSSSFETTSSSAAEPVVDPAMAEGSIDSSLSFLLRPPQVQDHERAAETERMMAPDEGDMIGRHLAVLGNSSAPERAVSRSQDALFTVLSGGYDAALRLEVAETLAPRLDSGLRELLRAHVEDIRQEALEFGQDDLTSRAERLLRRLDATD